MIRETMKVKDLLTERMYDYTGDIDVYDDYDERCAVAWCGTTLTDEGKNEFRRALDLTCEILWDNDGYYGNHVTVMCESEADARAITRLMNSMAGYCTEDEYNLWFKD